MAENQSIEDLIQIGAQLREYVGQLNDSLPRLERVIAREQGAVEQNDMLELEALTQDKLNLGSTMAKAYEQLRATAERLRRLRQALCGDTTNADVSLSQLLLWLHEIQTALPTVGLGPEVLQHVCRSLEVALHDFQERAKCLKPRVEANVYLTRRLLANHRQTIQFWQDLLSEAGQTYTPAGTPKPTQESPSVLRVKA